MVDKVDIANIALTGLRITKINDFADTSAGAEAVNAIWNSLLEAELSKHSYNFAIKRTKISQLSDTPLFGYSYQYQLPPDCLRLLTVDANLEYRVESGVILTDASTVYIKYISKNTDPATWSASFVDLFVTKLKAELAYPLTADVALMKFHQAAYNRLALTVRFQDAVEEPGQPLGTETPSLIKARY